MAKTPCCSVRPVTVTVEGPVRLLFIQTILNPGPINCITRNKFDMLYVLKNVIFRNTVEKLKAINHLKETRFPACQLNELWYTILISFHDSHSWQEITVSDCIGNYYDQSSDYSSLSKDTLGNQYESNVEAGWLALLYIPEGLEFDYRPRRRISVGFLSYPQDKAFWEELIAYFPWYDTGHIENNVSNNSSIVACVFVTAVTFLPSRWLATIGGFSPNQAVT
jgi:hypothetical protein